MPAWNHVVRTLDQHQRSAGQLGEPLGSLWSLTRVLGPVDEQYRAADVADGRLDPFEVPRERGLSFGEHRVDGAVDGPAGGVFDRLGRMRLRGDLREEEPGEPFVVARPDVAVVVAPALVDRELVIELRAGGLVVLLHRPDARHTDTECHDAQ